MQCRIPSVNVHWEKGVGWRAYFSALLTPIDCTPEADATVGKGIFGIDNIQMRTYGAVIINIMATMTST
jgi:hypothetical protein